MPPALLELIAEELLKYKKDSEGRHCICNELRRFLDIYDPPRYNEEKTRMEHLFGAAVTINH